MERHMTSDRPLYGRTFSFVCQKKEMKERIKTTAGMLLLIDFVIIFYLFIEQRKQEAEKIRVKYPERIPVNDLLLFFFFKHFSLMFYFNQVVVERVPKSQIPDIDKRKFLVPNDITIAQFMWIIRKRIQLAPEKAIFLFVNKTIPQSR